MSGTAARAGRDPRRERRRRLRRRVLFPFAIFAALWTFTAIAHATQTPDLSDPQTLSPTSTAPFGSATLAGRLRAQGTVIRVVGSTPEAMAVARSLDTATIFVSAPEFLRPTFGIEFSAVPGHFRLVLVQPGPRVRQYQPFAFGESGSRWATGMADPHCPLPEAVRAGRAAVRHSVYFLASVQGTVCYDGGLAEHPFVDSRVIAVGASDPFRNDRIDEVGNSALALGLLGGSGPVIWLDLHRAEPVPTPPAFPSSVTQIPLPNGPPGGQPGDGNGYRRDDRTRSSTGNPVIDAFPPLLWAALLAAAVVALLFAIARARRLGPPVSEPLAVLVPAAEAVAGRGRMYQKVHARAATLTALRASAVRRLNRVLNPFGAPVAERDLAPGPAGGAPPAADHLIAQVAARTGTDEATVRTVLYGRPPADDDGLAAAVANLDRLVAATLSERPGRPPSGPARATGPATPPPGAGRTPAGPTAQPHGTSPPSPPRSAQPPPDHRTDTGGSP